MVLLLVPLYLHKFQLHRRGPSENANQNPKLAFVRLDFLHHTVEVRKRPIHHLDILPNREENPGLWLDRSFFHLLGNGPHFFIAHRRVSSASTDETISVSPV